MIVPENFLKKLRTSFDLNIYEAKVWTALLSRGVATAGELAEISGVPRSRSYDVLESLEKKGFIIMKLGKPIKYLAVAPSEILKRLKSRVEIQATENIKNLEKVKETEIFQELELLHRQGIEKVDASDMSGMLKGRQNILNHIKSMINNAESSVVISTTEEGLKRKSAVLKSALKKAAQRGVKIKIAAPVENQEFILKEISDIAEIRKTEESRARFVIVDGKQVTFMLSDDSNTHEAYDAGVWVNTPYFVKALESMFELSWQNLKQVN